MTEGGLLSDEETYEALIQLMRDAELTWVAEEVEQAVVVGAVEVRAAPREPGRRSGEPEMGELRAIPSLHVQRTPFGARDRVRLAVTAFRRVVLEGLEMEAEVRHEFGARVLAAEDDEQSEPQVIVRDRSVDIEIRTHLQQLLSELEAEG